MLSELALKWQLLRAGGKIKIGKGSSVEFGAQLPLQLDDSISIGERCSIYRGAILSTHRGNIVIGDRYSVNTYTILYGAGGLTIGNDVRIAAHCVIIPSHLVFDDIEKTIKEQGDRQIGITIEDDVWIGANVTVLDGAYIRKGAVIGAGSVVRGETVPYGVYVGTPARLIRLRGEQRKTAE